MSKKTQKEGITKEEKAVIIGFAVSIILFITIYLIIIIVYGHKPPEEMPYWIRILLKWEV